jgi:hypothetical protein
MTASVRINYKEKLEKIAAKDSEVQINIYEW